MKNLICTGNIERNSISMYKVRRYSLDQEEESKLGLLGNLSEVEAAYLAKKILERNRIIRSIEKVSPESVDYVLNNTSILHGKDTIEGPEE